MINLTKESYVNLTKIYDKSKKMQKILAYVKNFSYLCSQIRVRVCVSALHAIIRNNKIL